jgi:hypothetical protein
LPLPSQLAAVVCVPPEQDAPEHGVPLLQFWQTPPSHLPSLPQLACAVVLHTPRGSTLPLVAAAQVPFGMPVSVAEQAWHASLHCESQQKPSWQNPVVHASELVHPEP